ncbi:hypothetical protein [Nocardioides lijunqiniae]|uniref:hypothetical protein n=1 Tax=Nocardioides lijunqiniae TaxID=2760832 RepID=UPI0018776DE6|nr:hypothetical protein [Nocardioides lijunqiniae]
MHANVRPIRILVVLFIGLAVVRVVSTSRWVGIAAEPGFVVATAATIEVARTVGTVEHMTIFPAGASGVPLVPAGKLGAVGRPTSGAHHRGRCTPGRSRPRLRLRPFRRRSWSIPWQSGLRWSYRRAGRSPARHR